MAVEFDPTKNALNVLHHGLSLADFVGFDDVPVVAIDRRVDYGETRQLAYGGVGGVGHCVVFTMRGEIKRLISLRGAHEKEMRRHERE